MLLSRKITNATTSLDDDAQWMKQINTTKYGRNNTRIPTTTPQEIQRYSESMLKHFPKKTLKLI